VPTYAIPPSPNSLSPRPQSAHTLGVPGDELGLLFEHRVRGCDLCLVGAQVCNPTLGSRRNRGRRGPFPRLHRGVNPAGVPVEGGPGSLQSLTSRPGSRAPRLSLWTAAKTRAGTPGDFDPAAQHLSINPALQSLSSGRNFGPLSPLLSVRPSFGAQGTRVSARTRPRPPAAHSPAHQLPALLPRRPAACHASPGRQLPARRRLLRLRLPQGQCRGRARSRGVRRGAGRAGRARGGWGQSPGGAEGAALISRAAAAPPLSGLGLGHRAPPQLHAGLQPVPSAFFYVVGLVEPHPSSAFPALLKGNLTC
jgi:hypothetical protein